MDDAVGTQRQDHCDDESAADDKGFPGMEFDFIDTAAVEENNTDDIAEDYGQRDVEERAQPVVAQMLEKPF